MMVNVRAVCTEEGGGWPTLGISSRGREIDGTRTVVVGFGTSALRSKFDGVLKSIVVNDRNKERALIEEGSSSRIPLREGPST